eukprot:3989837-Pleurochrysis_carterae.AAC.2
MADATHNHAAEFLPGGICPAEQITPELRERLSGGPMKSTGADRDDTRAGVLLAHAYGTAAWMRERTDGEDLKETRKAKLAAKRAATERARIDALPFAEHYSDLKLMGIEDMRDQLTKHKLLGKTGFALSLPNRTACVLQQQRLFLEANKDANDLEDGDSGIDRRS